MADESTESFGNAVASHYNSIEDVGGRERQKSRIVHLRNFNNWIKGMLIDHYLKKVSEKKKHREPLKVLDLACGKGGDLLKWNQLQVTHVVGVDIAEGSIEDCKNRYNFLCNRNSKERKDHIFKGHFFAADCTKTRLRSKYDDPTTKFSIVSCQFAFHYCFESLPQAEQMLQNVSECLEPGGYFIGTLPDANTIVSRHRQAGNKKFGNEIYHIEVEDSSFSLFGAKYDFHLKGVVNCPEFLVYFPVFLRLAEKYDLVLIEKKSFPDYFNEMKDTDRGKMLLQKMSALESYPPYREKELVGEESDYEHVAKFKSLSSEDKEESPMKRIGTLTASEWEVAGLYLVFAFQKRKPS
ncbi:mRNA cap guanine-N(7) methyltransferase [Bemisia tabaci]|nr:PREDICTED: mRNA cap guanine-N7 methyltransferase [Bemisia tabaci]XP_018917060.1 PREDICTED: mRNA cap guanine-N7 methyltransferase [Bemisia tabaci]XP_018917061.1 PREDICTED: mRNA cap guanine-N7 methyltransferase [Bemisia tabaci]